MFMAICENFLLEVFSHLIKLQIYLFHLKFRSFLLCTLLSPKLS